MGTRFSRAEVTSIRQPIDLGDGTLGQLSGFNERTIRAGDAGKHQATKTLAERLLDLKEQHNRALQPLIAAAEVGSELSLSPGGTEQRAD